MSGSSVEKMNELQGEGGPSTSGKKPVFQKGKFQVKIKVTSERVAGVAHMFTHDMQAFDDMKNMIANKVHQSELKVSSEPMEFELMKEKVSQMLDLMIAKKLASSFHSQDKIKYEGYFNRIAGMEMYGPTAIVPVVNGLGTIKENDVEFRMVGQPALAFTYFCRAVLPDTVVMMTVNQQINRASDYFVNLAWPEPFGMLREMITGIINAWVDTQPVHQLMVGGLPFEGRLPKVARGFAAFRALMGPIARPIHVARAITIGELIETIEAPAHGNFVQGDIGLFAAQGVRFVDLKQNDLTNFGGKYYDSVQSRIESAASNVLAWGSIRGFEETGSSWQLVQRTTDFYATVPMKIPSEQLTFGWMMAGNVGHILEHTMYSVRGERTGREEKLEYVESMLRGGKNKQ